jgi:hypothetical protein
MTFLNWSLLIGLAAIAIPIIIHLLNRQRATIVDWGAMRFLQDSMTSRSRRILIEEVILMALRCLAVALLALALARPFLPAHTTIPWAVVLPAFLIGAMLLGMAVAMWSVRRTRLILLGISSFLLVLAIGGSLAEYYLQGKRWSLSGGERDVVIVIDGSGSMQVPIDGRSNFARATDEARNVVESLKPADTVSLIVAGSVPRPLITNPTADRKEIDEALTTATPLGGTMRIIDSLEAANASLAQGANPGKKIVVITDGQALGWDVRSEARWQKVEADLKEFTVPPQVLLRTMPMPSSLRNAAVSDIRFSRRVIGTDRTVRIDVSVANSGTVGLPPMSVELWVDGLSVARHESGDIRVGAAETVRFDHRFDKPGVHLVAAKVVSEDELPSDNTGQRVVEVVDRLPVLLVDGDPSVRPLDGAAAFLEIALTPPDDDVAGTGLEGRAPSRPAVSPTAATTVPARSGPLVKLSTVAAPDIGTIPDFGRFSLVVLANVPRLPESTAAALRRYVADGGGLLVAPGDKAMPAFYDRWASDVGGSFMPALLGRREVLGDKPAHLGLKTLSHPALDRLTDATQSDAALVTISAFWTLSVDPRDRQVRVGGSLDTGTPLLVERKVGKGYVLMTAMAMDRKDSNLPTRQCFVPLVHELAYFLAAPSMVEANVRPGAEFAVELPLKTPALAKVDPKKPSGAAALLAGQVEVLAPGERKETATVTDTPRGVKVSFLKTYEPGLYHLMLPAKAGDSFVVPPASAQGIPFIVYDDANEGRLEGLTEAELAALGKRLPLFHATDTEKLITAVTEPVPGEELWKYLALALLAAILLETALTRWIAAQRRLNSVETVTFGSAFVDAKEFRDKARQMLEVAKE